MKTSYKLKIKSLLVGAAILLGAYASSSQAAITNFLYTAGGPTNFLASTNAWYINSVTVTCGTNAGTVKFYDNNVTNTVYTNAQYVSLLTFPTNVTQVITNSGGFLQTNIYPGQWTAFVTNAVNTNQLPIIFQASVPANGTVTFPNLQISTVLGLVINPSVTVAGTTNLGVQIQYNPWP